QTAYCSSAGRCLRSELRNAKLLKQSQRVPVYANLLDLAPGDTKNVSPRHRRRLTRRSDCSQVAFIRPAACPPNHYLVSLGDEVLNLDLGIRKGRSVHGHNLFQGRRTAAEIRCQGIVVMKDCTGSANPVGDFQIPRVPELLPV